MLRRNARAGKGGAGVGVGPGVAAVGGPVDVVDIVVREAAAAFVHARDVDGPVARQVAGDLDVADEGLAVVSCRSLVQVAPLSVEKRTWRRRCQQRSRSRKRTSARRTEMLGLLSDQPDSRSSELPL